MSPTPETTPRLTLVPVGNTGTVCKVLHAHSGKSLGVVVRMAGTGNWAWICPESECREAGCSESPSAEAAALALNAHVIGHGLERLLADVAEGRIVVPAGAVTA